MQVDGGNFTTDELIRQANLEKHLRPPLTKPAVSWLKLAEAWRHQRSQFTTFDDLGFVTPHVFLLFVSL